MKKILSACIILSLFGCNNNNSNSQEKGNSVTGASENTSAITGCKTLILFHKGAIIEATSYDADGKETTKQSTTVTDVKEDGGLLIATASAMMNNSATGDKTINLVYKCDGNNLYMDITSMHRILKD